MTKKTIACFLALSMLLGMFVTASAADAGFKDVTKGSWFYEEVVEMTSRGIFTGYGDGTFRPDNSITAAELVATLVRTFGSESIQNGNPWYQPYMDYALDEGWFTTGDLFVENYNKPISRELSAKLLVNAKNIELVDVNTVDTSIIQDYSWITPEYRAYVVTAYLVGYFEGTGSGFGPKGVLKRSEAATIVYRALVENPEASVYVSVYDTLKATGKFYERQFDDPLLNTLTPKALMTELSDKEASKCPVVISHAASQVDGKYVMVENKDIQISVKNPSLEYRRALKEILKVAYPTGYEQVYTMCMQTWKNELLEYCGCDEVWAKTGSYVGTFGTHYLDGREVNISKQLSHSDLQIRINETGYVNPDTPSAPTQHVLDTAPITSLWNTDMFGTYWIDLYQLNIWD